MAQKWPKMTQNGPKWPKYDPKWPKMTQNGRRMTQNDPKLPKMAQNYPNWPKNDAQIYKLFPQFFFTEKAVPQTFSLLECMAHSNVKFNYIQLDTNKGMPNCPLLWCCLCRAMERNIVSHNIRYLMHFSTETLVIAHYTPILLSPFIGSDTTVLVI